MNEGSELRGKVADWLGESLTGTLIPPITDIVLSETWKPRLRLILTEPNSRYTLYGVPVRWSRALDPDLVILNHADGVPSIIRFGREPTQPREVK